jgi:hypothetical protein
MRKKKVPSPGGAAVRKKLGGLAARKNETLREVILDRGGSTSNVNMAGPWANRTLEETAIAAVAGKPGSRDRNQDGKAGQAEG